MDTRVAIACDRRVHRVVRRRRSEAANLLALNLIDEIVRGTRDAEGAMRFYRDALRDGVITAYEERLMFTPRTRAARR